MCNELYFGNVRKMHNGRNDDMSKHFSRKLQISHAQKCNDLMGKPAHSKIFQS